MDRFRALLVTLILWYHYHHQPGYSQNTTESAPLLQWPRRGHLLSRKNVYFRIQSVLAHRKEPWSKSAISIMCGPFQYLDIPGPSPRYEGCSNYPELHLASLSAAHHTSPALQCMQSHAHHLYCTAVHAVTRSPALHRPTLHCSDRRVHRWLHQRLWFWRYNTSWSESWPPMLLSKVGHHLVISPSSS